MSHLYIKIISLKLTNRIINCLTKISVMVSSIPTEISKNIMLDKTRPRPKYYNNT